MIVSRPIFEIFYRFLTRQYFLIVFDLLAIVASDICNFLDKYQKVNCVLLSQGDLYAVKRSVETCLEVRSV